MRNRAHDTKLKIEIVKVLKRGKPKTDEQIQEALAKGGILHTPSGQRGRRAELVRAKKIRSYGVKGKTKAGRRCNVWGLA